MKDLNEIFKVIEDNLANMDEKVNEKLSALYDKLDEYRDAFKKNTSGDSRTVTVNIDHDGDTKTVTVDIDDNSVKKPKKKDNLVEMAPFLDNESLHELVVAFLEGGLEVEMAEILPFLSSKDIALLVGRLKETGAKEFKGLHLGDLLPFADDICIDEMFMEKCLKGELDESLIPFVSNKCWHELVVKYCENEDSSLNIDEIYPFLSRDDLKLLFKTYLKRRSKKE